MSVRFGVVGAGDMGVIYGANLRDRVPGAELVAVTGGSRAAGLATRLGVAYEPSFEALVDRRDIDAVTLCSPTQFHRDQTVRAADAGKHVFTEKPMAVTLEDCDAMTGACGRGGVVLTVNAVTRYRRGPRMAKELVDQGAIGKLRMIRHTYCFVIYDYAAGKSWLVDPGAGSPFLDQGAHCNDYIRWVVGAEAVSVAAEYGSYTPGPPPDQSAMVTYRFANGVLAQLWCSYEFPAPGLGPKGNKIEYLFIGSDGMIEVEYYGALQLGRGDHWETLYEHPPVDLVADPSSEHRAYPYGHQLEDFVEAIQTGRPPLVTGEDGRAGIEMAVAADLAAAEHRTVALPFPR